MIFFSWLFWGLSRDESNLLLKNFGEKMEEDIFLIRNSSIERHFVLSIFSNDLIKNYLIKQNNHREYYIDYTHTFKYIDELVEFFCKEKILTKKGHVSVLNYSKNLML